MEEVEVTLPIPLDPFFVLGQDQTPEKVLVFYEGGSIAPSVDLALEMVSCLSEKLFERLGANDREAFLKGFRPIYEGLKIMAGEEMRARVN